MILALLALFLPAAPLRAESVESYFSVSEHLAGQGAAAAREAAEETAAARVLAAWKDAKAAGVPSEGAPKLKITVKFQCQASDPESFSATPLKLAGCRDYPAAADGSRPARRFCAWEGVQLPFILITSSGDGEPWASFLTASGPRCLTGSRLDLEKLADGDAWDEFPVLWGNSSAAEPGGDVRVLYDAVLLTVTR